MLNDSLTLAQVVEQYLDSIKVNTVHLLSWLFHHTIDLNGVAVYLQNVGLHRQNAGMYERRGQSETE